MGKWLLAVIAVVAVAGSAQAAEKKGRYGDAGCGLGSMLIGDKPGFVQVFAATLNGTFGNQTFAISTGTSNCGASGSATTKVFVEANREALAKDISRGSGETISTLTHITGCSDAQAVGASLQRNFGSIFPSESVSNDKVTESILQTLQSDSALTCKNIG